MFFPPRSNPIEILETHVALYLRLRNGKVLECLVDFADLDLVRSQGYRWCAQWNPCTKSFYATGKVPSRSKRSMLGMHRLIMGFPVGMDVDHINHNTLDNRRENLRSVPHYINGLNRGRLHATNTSGFRGVSRNGNKWRALIWCNSKRINIGCFETKEEAAAAFQAKYAELTSMVAS